MPNLPTAIGSNPIPPGGPTALQTVPPSGTPGSLAQLIEQLTPVQQRFRRTSSLLDVLLDQAAYSGVGASATQKVSSVGLGIETITHHHIVLPLVNAAVGAQTVTLSPYFPYNLLSSTSLSINGGASVYNCSGVLGMFVMARRRRGLLAQTTLGVSYGPQLSPSLCTVSVGANGVVTNAGVSDGSWSGIKSISVAGSSTCTLTIDFITFEPYAYDYNSLLGMIPLQNSSTFATLKYTLASSILTAAATPNVPLYSAGANITASITGGGTSYAQSKYVFATIPADPGLYVDMVSNSYQVQEQDGLSIASVSNDGVVYNIPRNAFFVAAHLLSNDNNGAYVSYANFGNLKFRYNAGTIVVANQETFTTRAKQYRSYNEDIGLYAGYRLWDGDDTANSVYITDDMGWVNVYEAADPQLVTTLASGVAVPVTVNIAREQVVAGAVQVV